MAVAYRDTWRKSRGGYALQTNSRRGQPTAAAKLHPYRAQASCEGPYPVKRSRSADLLADGHRPLAWRTLAGLRQLFNGCGMRTLGSAVRKGRFGSVPRT